LYAFLQAEANAAAATISAFVALKRFLCAFLQAEAEAAAATQLSVLKQQLAAAQATNATFTT